MVIFFVFKFVRNKKRIKIKYEIFIGFIVVCVLLFGILPRITVFFTQNHVKLPIITRVFMGISSFFLSIYGVIFIAIIIAGIYFFKKYIDSPKGDLWFSRFKLN